MRAQTNRVGVSDLDILNLGCGRNHRGNAWNVDISADVSPDQQVDLQEMPWPWPDDSFQTIIARHVLEHLDPVPWSELLRVLSPGGYLKLTYPIGHTRYEDPTHKQYWNLNTAEALAGERKHGHEHHRELELLNLDVDWSLSPPTRLMTWWVRYRLWQYGAGPWLEQVPGLYGEVTATYTYSDL